MQSNHKSIRVPCVVYPGAFSGELQFQVTPPGEEAIHVFASNSTTDVQTHLVTNKGVNGYLRALLVQDLGDRVIIDLPGETLPRGPRIRVPKSFVLQS